MQEGDAEQHAHVAAELGGELEEVVEVVLLVDDDVWLVVEVEPAAAKLVL